MVVAWTSHFSEYPVRSVVIVGNDLQIACLHPASYNDTSQERQTGQLQNDLGRKKQNSGIQIGTVTSAHLRNYGLSPILHHHIHFYLFPLSLPLWNGRPERKPDRIIVKLIASQKFGEPQNLLVF